MGFPGIVEKYSHILSNCTGQFVRHHTLGKGKTKTDTTNAVMQTMAQLMQKALLKDKEDFYVADGQTGSFMEKFFKLHD